MRVCAENLWNTCGVDGEVAAAQLELLLGEHDDRTTLRRLVRERGELRDVGELLLGRRRRRNEREGLPVTERDGAGLVEQQHVDIAGRLDGAARGRDHVRAHHAVHAGDADRGQQGADRRRDQAHQQRDEHGQRDDRALPASVDGELRERRQRRGREQEHDRHHREQDRQRDLVRRPAALGALDHRDHAIEEAFAFPARDAHDDPVRQHARAAGDRREIAAGLAQHGRGFAGDGAFVDRRDAFDDLAVGRNDVVGLDEHQVALAQRARLDRVVLACVLR